MKDRIRRTTHEEWKQSGVGRMEKRGNEGIENRVSGKKTINRPWVRRMEGGGDAFGKEL